jgi:UDP-glucose 4-epimerase
MRFALSPVGGKLVDRVFMKCLFIGGGGYIGRHLVAALRAAGHDTEVVGAGSSGEGRADLADASTLSGVDWKVDCVFVFAGVTGTTDSFNQVERYVRGNEIVLLNVLDSLRRSGERPRVIFPSSRLVYKGSDTPLPESASLEAKTVYAANKIACEYHLQAFANAFDVPYSIFRICVPYGNSVSEQYSFGTIGNFISQAKQHGRIRLYGGGEVRRTFTHIDDLCRLIIQGAASAKCENQTFNVPGEDLSLFEAATLIAERLGVAVESAQWPAFDLRIESGSTVFDGALLLSILETEPAHRMFDWVRDIA